MDLLLVNEIGGYPIKVLMREGYKDSRHENERDLTNSKPRPLKSGIT